MIRSSEGRKAGSRGSTACDPLWTWLDVFQASRTDSRNLCRGFWEVLVGLMFFKCLSLLTGRGIHNGVGGKLKHSNWSAHDLCLTSFVWDNSGSCILLTHMRMENVSVLCLQWISDLNLALSVPRSSSTVSFVSCYAQPSSYVIYFLLNACPGIWWY